MENRKDMPNRIWVIENEDDNVLCDFVADRDREIFTKSKEATEYTMQNERMLQLLNIMTSLVRLHYGNSDKEIYKLIEESESLLKG